MEKTTEKIMKNTIRTELSYFYGNHLSKLRALTLSGLLRRKNVFLLAALNQPPERIITESVRAFATASMETIFGHCLQRVLLKLLECTYNTVMTSSGKSIDIDVVTSKARLTLDLKSGSSTHNATSESAAKSDLNAARVRLRMDDMPVFPLLATCYGRRKTQFSEDKLRVQGQTLWYLSSKDENCYKKIVRMFTRQTKVFRRKLETATNGTIERLINQFKVEFCQNGISVEWDKLAELSCKNLTEETKTILKEKIIG